MYRNIIFVLIGLSAAYIPGDVFAESWSTWSGSRTLAQSSNCIIVDAGTTVLRCQGASHLGKERVTAQSASLIYACVFGKLSLSLRHAMVGDKVLSHRFEQGSGNGIEGTEQVRKSRVRTGFWEQTHPAALWVYRNVLSNARDDALHFSLNGGEVMGEFNFDDSDRALFEKFFSERCQRNSEKLLDKGS